MSLRRSLVPIARTSRPIVSRGVVPYRVLSTRSVSERRRGVSLAVASTLGLSLAAFYALVVDPVHADQPRDRDTDLPATGDEEILTLRALKSVDSFGLHDRTEDLLRKYEESHHLPSTSGISRYDIAQVASNNPLEDDHAEAVIASGDSHWSFFAVLDGHNGWETSALLRGELIDSVAKELTAVVDQSFAPSVDTGGSDPFSAAIGRAFTRVDDRIVHESVDQVFQAKTLKSGVNLLAPAYAGACALLAFHDSKTSVLRVALTGDCRAVLGRKRPDGKFNVEVLTADQNGNNPDERKRLEAAHPGEEVVKNGRTMGFGPARAFGDARYKWSREVQDKLKRDYLGRTPLETIKTPPYFTAEPVVTATDVKSGDFVILATDGLWECLSNQEAVGLVGQWVHQQVGWTASWLDSWHQWWASGSRSELNLLPVVCDGGTEKAVDDSLRYQQWCAEKKFVTIDPNAATHLVRNALGGANQDLREALLSMRSPRARTYWDDITATVVFFRDKT